MSEEIQGQSSGDEATVSRRAVIVAAGATGLAAVTGETASAQEKTSDAGDFSPQACTFQEGIERVKKAIKEHGITLAKGQIITSKDAGFSKLGETLKCPSPTLPSGFVKFQLPVYFEGGPGSQFYLSIGNPYTKVGKHSHDEGDGLRYIVSGSITYENKELQQGDWMFIPKGASYSFQVGPRGATMFYCYQCCCA
jgi:hypothetical protein